MLTTPERYQRDLLIYTEYTQGAVIEEVAERHDLSVRQAYRVIKVMQEHLDSRAQVAL